MAARPIPALRGTAASCRQWIEGDDTDSVDYPMPPLLSLRAMRANAYATTSPPVRPGARTTLTIAAAPLKRIHSENMFFMPGPWRTAVSQRCSAICEFRSDGHRDFHLVSSTGSQL